MKKIFWFLASFALLAALGLLLKNSWDTAKFIQTQGREATLKVGKKYNTSRWSAPIPLKKIHAYTAVLLPDHEVLIESDQELPPGTEYFIRFLTRDIAEQGRALSRLPLVNTMRLKSEADGTPVKLADTDLMDRAIDKAMGPPAEGVFVAQRPVAEAAPDRAKPTVPFLFTGSKDPVPEVLWNNSTIGELFVIAAWAFMSLFFFLHAWSVPLFPGRKAGSERKDFVHSSQRRIEPDAPEVASVRLKYKPKPAEAHLHDNPPGATAPAPPAPPPKAASIPMPANMKITPRVTRPEDDSRATTAPFVPPDGSPDTALKLKRRPSPEVPPSPSEPPAQA
jgi:hypothetical protein